MNKAIKNTLVAASCVGVLGLTAGKLLGNKQEVEEKVYKKDPNTRVLVQADTLCPRALTFNTEYLGTFEPSREVVLSTELQGTVTRVGVQEGQPVRAGSLVAQLNTDEVQARLVSAQASYADAALNQQRYENAARESEGVSQAQVDNARLQAKTTLAQLKQAQKQVALGRIVAPFSGIITTRGFDLGAVVSPGAQLATLTDISALKLAVKVPEEAVVHFRPGQALTVQTDVHPGIDYHGTVTQVGAKADDAHQYKVEVRVPNPTQTELKAGMYGSVVERNSTAPNSLAISRAALLGSAKKPQVYVVQPDGNVSLRDIRTGRSTEELLEVLSGLHAGDVVVTSGQTNLAQGAAVTVAK